MRNANNILQEIQSSIAQNNHKWEAVLSDHTALEVEDLQKMLGYRPSKNELSLSDREAKSKSRPQIRVGKKPDLAEQIDWRNFNNHNYISSIKNQGMCGSCVGFGITAAMETRARFLKNIPEDAPNANSLPDLSAAQLFYCGVGGNLPCFQGWGVEEGLEFANLTGVVPDACFPYPASPTLYSGCDTCDDWESQLTKIGTYKQLDNHDEMKAWIATKGPAITGFTVYLDLYFYKSGVYIPQDVFWNLQVGGHCVAVIGYDDDKQAWLAKNSWGANWGDAGFFYIGYNQCGFDAQMWGIEDFQSIYQSTVTSTNLNQGGVPMKESNDKQSKLSRKQIGLVQDAVGEMMKDTSVLADILKDSDSKLKALLTKAGANDADLKVIMGYFDDVQNNLDDETHLGGW